MISKMRDDEASTRVGIVMNGSVTTSIVLRVRFVPFTRAK